MAEWALLSARAPRYLLPLGLLVPLAGVEFLDLVDRRIVPRPAAIVVTAVVLRLGSLSMREFSGFNYLWKNPPDRWTEARRLQQVFDFLKVSVKEVDRALASGETVAVVGYTHGSGAPGCWDVAICTGGLEGLVANPESISTVDGKYFVYPGADRELLKKLGFRFWD